MSQLWTIIDTASGAVLYAAYQTPSAGSHPKDNGWAWDASTQKATRISAAPDLTRQTWSGTAWVENLPAIQAAAIDDVKAEAERRKMLVLSAGGAKKVEYADKRREVIQWDSLGNTAAAILLAFNALPTAIRNTRFAYAIADAAAFGDTPADAIVRFRAAMVRSDTIPTISAAEAKACGAIRAAITAASARAAAAAFMGK